MKVNEIVKNNFQQLASSSSLTEEIDNIGIVQDFEKDTVLLKEKSGRVSHSFSDLRVNKNL